MIPFNAVLKGVAVNMDWRIRHNAVTESTNRDALGGMPGDVFTAGMQTAGRGRLDHKWLSPPGENLMMSAVVDVTDMPPQEAATLPLIAGLSVAEAMCGIFTSHGVDRLCPVVKVKWPNDVHVAGRKICGILCERNGDRVIVGIGVNVNQTVFAHEISNLATSVRMETGTPHNIDGVRDAVLSVFAGNIARLRTAGFQSLLPRLEEFDCLKGRHVTVRRTDDDGEPVSGRCGGIRSDGTLDVAGEAVSAGEAHIMRDGSRDG